MINDGTPLPPTVYPLAKGRVWGLLAGSLVFVALGVAFLIAHSSVKMTVAGALAVPFFGFCALIIFQRLRRGRPELVLDDSGVEHAQLGRFTWDEIAAVRIREQRAGTTSQRYIELVLHDPDAYVARAPRLVRSAASMNARLGFGPANVPTSALPVPAEAVLDAMRRHRPGLVIQP